MIRILIADPDPADDTARDGKTGGLFSAREHGYKEQSAKPDNGNRPDGSPIKDGEKVTGFSYHQLDNDTLAMFLFFLNNVYHATATFHGQILPLYIQGINHKNVLAFSD